MSNYKCITTFQGIRDYIGDSKIVAFDFEISPDDPFTIMEVREGKGSDAGWGRLKSGAGWISLDYCQRV